MTRTLVPRALLAAAFACIACDLEAGPVNINSADAATLARELKGVGLKRAKAIVDYRNKNGPFKSADELALVKGVGKGAIDNNRAEIRLDVVKGPAKPVAPPAPATSRIPRP